MFCGDEKSWNYFFILILAYLGYAYKISHIRTTTFSASSFKIFWKCSRVTHYDELIIKILLSQSEQYF